MILHSLHFFTRCTKCAERIFALENQHHEKILEGLHCQKKQRTKIKKSKKKKKKDSEGKSFLKQK